MKPSICKCCGEPIASGAESDARNPNVCFSCASLVEEIQDNTIIESAIPAETEQADDAPAEEELSHPSDLDFSCDLKSEPSKSARNGRKH